MPKESGNDVLVRFARLASEARTGAAILPLLADALARQVGADAVAVLEIQANGRAAFIASPHCPKELEALTLERDVIGEELGKELLVACKGRFEKVHSRPLASGGGLFGFVVMFFGKAHAPEQLPLAEGLVDLASIALGSAAQIQQLVKSNAELLASQEALARTEKLRALGQMAAGVSHDFKNILNPLSLLVQVAARAIDRGQTSDVKESIAEMKQVLTRGVQTIERLRDYSRQAPESRAEEVDLNQVVHEASEIARPRMTAHGRVCSIREELGDPPAVLGRSGEIVSALVNLIVNAHEAMRDGGTITLRTGESDRGSWVQVADDGPGMPPDVESRVFEPFFTTKGGDGTGLGLAIVYATMQRHGGTVRLETALGKGTTFTLWFPKSA